MEICIYDLMCNWGGSGFVVIVVFNQYCYCDLWVDYWCKVDEQCVILVLFCEFFSVVFFILFDVEYLGGVGFVGNVIIGQVFIDVVCCVVFVVYYIVYGLDNVVLVFWVVEFDCRACFWFGLWNVVDGFNYVWLYWYFVIGQNCSG